MKRIALLLLFILPLSASAKNLSSAIELSSVLTESFPEFHSWPARCVSEISFQTVSCTVERNATQITSTRCVAKGYAYHAGQVIERTVSSLNLIAALRSSGVRFNRSVSLKNLMCETRYNGYAGCGGVENDVTTCTVDEIVAD